MRFFTNENKDADDVDVKDRGGDHSGSTDSSDTVALPQQRGNSPWSSTPDTDTSPHTDSSSTDTTGTHRRDDEPLLEDPTPPDHAVADTSPDATADPRTDTADPRDDSADPVTDTAGKDATLKDDGGFDDPKAVDPVTEKPLEKDETTDDETTEGKGATLKDDGGFDDPKVADTEPAPVASEAAVPDAPVAVAPVTTDDTPATEAKPGEIPAPEVTTIFGADDAAAFQDRWRDVQLRFVDSPKEATAEAAALVDDAVEKLTAALRGQKDSFGGESTDDTEKLRVELRGYREIFNRIIGL